jgi:hypothetical protein
MNHTLRKLLVTSVATGAVIAGGSTLASALQPLNGDTPAQVTTPAAVSRSITVQAHRDLPTVGVDQALPVTARTTGSMPVQGSWDRQTPAAVDVHPALGAVNIAQNVGQIAVPAVTITSPANVDYGLSSNGAEAGLNSNIVAAGTAVSPNGPALAEVSTRALSVDNKLQVAAL